MIKVGIIGAAGYTGGELLRILTYHPDVEIVWAVSRSNFGKPVYDVHADLFGDTELKFAEQPTEKADVVFFCTAHGETGKLLTEYNFPSDVKIIDMDFLKSTARQSKNVTALLIRAVLQRQFNSLLFHR